MNYQNPIELAVNWLPVGAFGWIKRDDAKPDLFVHIRYCATQFTPELGQRVQFEIVVDARNARGRLLPTASPQTATPLSKLNG